MISIILEIIFAGLQIAKDQTGGSNKPINTVSLLTEIIQKGIYALEQQTGKPIDPELIKPYVPIP
jgi:hypothetical protein